MSRYQELEGLFLLKDTIGSGGFGKVKLATHLLTGEKVAIKIMNKQALGENILLDEHHNVKIIDFGLCAKPKFKGYAHRDLKPENILLDEHHNVKIIDFGLCAKPKGGMDHHLYTPCGSAAYAAPELVSGKEYLGDMADVWSMGVLLYALLCGYLPFDDDSITVLCKKINAGKYSVPPWLSPESIEIIDQLLQVNPMRRISMRHLLNHPWVCQDGKPVIWKPQSQEIDEDCLIELAVFKGTSRSRMINMITEWKYDYLTCTYFLLLEKKKKGLLLRLYDARPLLLPLQPKCLRDLVLNSSANQPKLSVMNVSSLHQTLTSEAMKPSHLKYYFNAKHSEKKDKLLSYFLQLSSSFKNQTQTFNTLLQETMDNTFAVPLSAAPTPRSRKCKSVKPTRRSRSPLMGRQLQQLVEGKDSTTPSAKSGTQVLSPSRSVDSQLNNLNLISPASEFHKATSLDTDLHHSGFDRNSERKSFRKNGMFGSLEKVFKMFSPRGKYIGAGPRKVKTIHNVFRTEQYSPELVLSKLKDAIHKKYIGLNQSEYVLRCYVSDDKGKVKLAFNLEVCAMPKLPFVGIRCKRVKGDTWQYKKFCEDIIKSSDI
ncbi:maternal embryonic leucine zipper kinase [Octopus bimaculoides]|nr:maternal embryonic leucine zipper kinase [Octopus bimaculoides]|eukprot:XP_014769598.1 PREDICTED: maternal embryonic leucine zipper kinase-like [Octopus bimaculoides]